jgi:hypothetical protein
VSASKDELLHYVEDRILQLKTELRYLEQLRELLVASSAAPAVEPSEADLDNLPWRPYSSGRGEWIYRDEAPEALVARLEREGKGVVIGKYVYSLRSGATGKVFVSRREVGSK